MKKRVLAIVAAAVLALGCFASVSAKTLSETVAGNKAQSWLDGDVTNIDGIQVIYDGEKGSDYKIADIHNYEGDDPLAVLARLYAQFKPKPVRIFDLTCADADEDDPVEIKIVDNDIKDTKSYITYHYNKKTAIWDTDKVVVTGKHNGWVAVKVYEASPVALCTGKAGTTTTNGAANGKTAAAGTGKVAPKTGEV